MRVSVIVVRPAHEGLRAASRSAFAAEQHYDFFGDLPDSDLQLDPTFGPLPLPAGMAERIDLASASSDNAPLFVERGTIDVQRVGELVTVRGGAQIFADPEIGLFNHCGPNPIGNASVVARRLNVAGLHNKGLTGRNVALAIMDTGINVAHLRARGCTATINGAISWAPPGVPLAPGNYAVNHGTMCAYDALIAAPDCTLLDFPILQSRTPGGSRMAGFLSDALRAYSFLLQQFRDPAWSYGALVLNNSWGMYHPSWDFPPGHPGRYADNPNHPFNIIVSTIVRAGADVLFAAGNCGANCPDHRCQGVTRHTITGANAHPEVMTLAACDVRGTRLGYSSQGPSIPGMGATKPDLTAYAHFVGSEAFGPGSADTGTSTACPVAAGCVAAIRTRLPPTVMPPAVLFQQFIAHATPTPGPNPGWNQDYGFGIINALDVARANGL